MDAALQENEELKRRLKEMTAEAANNETILKRTQARELTLLRADSLAQLLRAMVDGLRESYTLDAVSVVLLDPQHEIRHLLVAGGDRPDEFKQIFFVDSLVGLAPQLAALHKPWLGPYTGADHHLLFPGSTHLKSTALVPLPRKDRATGALCFGSRDPARFTRHHGTDFLAHLGADGAEMRKEVGAMMPREARRDHRFPDRLAQPSLPATALEGGTGARPAQRRIHRLPDDRHRPLQGHQRRLWASGRGQCVEGDRQPGRDSNSQHGHGRPLRRR
jgi:uncharacterized protein YigA (DUF484 family)